MQTEDCRSYSDNPSGEMRLGQADLKEYMVDPHLLMKKFLQWSSEHSSFFFYQLDEVFPSIEVIEKDGAEGE